MAADYAPDKVDLVFGGHRVSGFAAGTFIALTMRTDSDALTVGADGLSAYARSLDRSATITVTLMPNSASNDVLSSFWAAQGTGVVYPCALLDRNGRTVGAAPGCRISKQPDVSFADAVETRVWTITCDRWQMFVGGSPEAPTAQ
jgi:hypothetical protein